MTKALMVSIAFALTMDCIAGQGVVLSVAPEKADFTVRIGDRITASKEIAIGAGIPGTITPVAAKFKYMGVTLANPNAPMPPNFIVVSPPSGTTSSGVGTAQIAVGLNENVVRGMRPGTYQLEVNFATVDELEPTQAAMRVVLHLSPPARPPVIRTVVNSASLQPGISPGSLVSVVGANFGPPVQSTSYDDTGTYPTAIDDGEPPFGYTIVQFNGIPAPLLAVRPGQIDAIVPYGVAGQESVDVVVSCYNNSSEAFAIPILESSPAVFTATASGSGQGAILNLVDNVGYSDNSVDNPAEKGSEIVMYATGFGSYEPPVPDGTLNLVVMQPTCAGTPGGLVSHCRRLSADPLTLKIGGKEAKILYAGPIPYQPYSRLQIRARVPEDADSGEQPPVVTVGQRNNSQQQVTIAIR